MTKRDYVLIAAVLKDLGDSAAHCFDSGHDRVSIADTFADALAAENPNFDRTRFIAASTFEGDMEEYNEEQGA